MEKSFYRCKQRMCFISLNFYRLAQRHSAIRGSYVSDENFWLYNDLKSFFKNLEIQISTWISFISIRSSEHSKFIISIFLVSAWCNPLWQRHDIIFSPFPWTPLENFKWHTKNEATHRLKAQWMLSRCPELHFTMFEPEVISAIYMAHDKREWLLDRTSIQDTCSESVHKKSIESKR